MGFQPVGSQARWRIVYEVLAAARVGDEVTYEELAAALGFDASHDRHRIQMAVRRAGEELEAEDHRALSPVTNVGYRIVEPEEHLVLARRHQSRSSKSLVRGQSKVINVDLSGLDLEVKHTFEVVARAFALQMDFNRRFQVKQEQLEQTMALIEQVSSRSEQEIAELKDRLERLEGS